MHTYTHFTRALAHAYAQEHEGHCAREKEKGAPIISVWIIRQLKWFVQAEQSRSAGNTRRVNTRVTLLFFLFCKAVCGKLPFMRVHAVRSCLTALTLHLLMLSGENVQTQVEQTFFQSQDGEYGANLQNLRYVRLRWKDFLCQVKVTGY